MENRIKVKIKQCYDTEENYKTNNPVLLEGQLAYTKDKYGKYKIGDGVSHWNDLDYIENCNVNIFDTRMSSVKIDFSDDKYKNKLTYAIATTAADADLPDEVTDGNILNFGWDNAKWGRQILFANNNTVWFRRSDGEGIYGDWTQVGGGNGGAN